MAGAPALFLDRDGVINHETNYLYRKEDVLWVEGIFQLVRTARALGYVVVVVTNQAGIAKGLYTEDDFHALTEWMRTEFAREDCALDAVYFSPWHPQAVLEQYRREHEDRKPGAGMLLRAQRELGVDISRSILVGDRCSDIAAARNAGCREAFLIRGTEPAGCKEKCRQVEALSEVEAWLVENSAA